MRTGTGGGTARGATTANQDVPGKTVGGRHNGHFLYTC